MNRTSSLAHRITVGATDIRISGYRISLRTHHMFATGRPRDEIMIRFHLDLDGALGTFSVSTVARYTNQPIANIELSSRFYGYNIHSFYISPSERRITHSDINSVECQSIIVEYMLIDLKNTLWAFMNRVRGA